MDMALSALTLETTRWLWDELQMIPPLFLLCINEPVNEYGQ